MTKVQLNNSFALSNVLICFHGQNEISRARTLYVFKSSIYVFEFVFFVIRNGSTIVCKASFHSHGCEENMRK